MTTDHVIELSNEQPTKISPPPCNADEFIKKVFQIVRARERRKLWFMFLIIIVLTLLSIICFICTAQYNTLAVIPGIFLIVIAFVLTIVVLVFCCEYSFVGENHLKLIGNVQHLWQLTDETWNKQVDSLQTVPFKVIGCCHGSRYQRLKNRLYGNIIVTPRGILIDELYFIDYGEVSVNHIAQITDSTGTYILRMHLSTRINYKTACSNGKPTEFDFDLIIPSNFQQQDTFKLHQQILSQSRICPVNFHYEQPDWQPIIPFLLPIAF